MTIAAVILLCVGLVGYAVYMDNRRLAVDPASYTPLLDLIANVESKDNYNAYFGNADNTSTNFTQMTIAQVQSWQAAHIADGHASSAVGRYQIIDTTLSELVRQQGIDTNRKFDKLLQDQLAIALLERRGSEKLVNREITKEQFAANLAMEWAAFPKVIGPNPDTSYYDGDGLNSSLVSVEQVLKAIAPIKPQ